MLENIEVIASIIGLVGAIWAFIKFVFNPYFRKRKEFSEISGIVKDGFERWNEFNFSFRGGTMISYENFLIVNKYRMKYKSKSPELKAFLLINAIKNGLGGNWGFWITINKDNKNILLPLFLALNNSHELRPAWRSAYILSLIFKNNINKIDNFLEQTNILNTSKNSFLKKIKSNKIEIEMIELTKKGTIKEKEKIPLIIEEIEKFKKEINYFLKQQTIINQI